MKTKICSAVAVILLPTLALANNDMSEAGRGGTISAPSIDESSHNPSTVNVNQGRASYSIPIVLPPGHPKVQPSVSLAYSGSRKEGGVGGGWSLTIPRIRVRKIGRGGQPRFDAAVTYIGLNGEPLIDVVSTIPDQDQDGTDEAVFFEERNTTRARYVQLSDGGWLVQQTDGTVLKLGTSADTQIAREGFSTHISTWLPETLEDRRGNQQAWIWSDGADVAATIGDLSYNTVARYLTEIRWGCQDCESATTYQSLTLDYESLPTHILDFSAGFLEETEFFVSALKTWTVVGGSAAAVRTYALTYDGCSDTRRLLCQIDVSGADGTTLPPITLTYTDYASPTTPADVNDPPGITFSDGVQPVDVDVDGRIDVADMSNATIGIDYYKSTGSTESAFSSSATTLNAASGKLPGASLGAGLLVSFEDATRSLTLDLFDLVPDATGKSWLFAHNQADGWGVAGEAITLPGIAIGSNTLRADIDRDGNVDLLDTSTYPWTLYLDDGSRTFPETVTLTAETTPTFGSGLLAADDGVVIGDVNGDGFPDVVYLDVDCISDWGRVYWGRGIEGFGWIEGEDRDAPFFSQYSSYPITSTLDCPAPAESTLADIDGDGFADLVSLEASTGHVRVWKNVPGVGFTDSGLGSPFTQVISDTEGCRIADFDNDGIREIICSDGWKIYDFADQNPHLLASVDNGRGSVTTLTYTTSARVAAAHAAAGSAWDRNVSMILPVVQTLETDDSRGNVLLRYFDYRDPFYLRDELEQRFEFVGFGYSATQEIPMLETTPGDPATRTPDPQDFGALTRRWFDGGETDYYLRGVELCAETWDLLTPPQTYTCDEDGALTRIVKTTTAAVEANGLTTVVELESVDRYELEGGPASSGERIRTEYEHDAYGNRTVERHFGVFDTAGDEQMIVTDYVHNTDDWLVSLPRMRQRGGMDLSGSTPTLDLLEADCIEYDSTSALCDPVTPYNKPVHDALVDEGLITGTWLLDDDDPTDFTPGTWALVSQATHTLQGLRNIITDAELNQTDIDYDADFGLFEIQRTVDPGGLDLVTTSLTDSKHGQVVQRTAADGELTEAIYDDLGRLTTLIYPGDTVGSPSFTRTYLPGTPISRVIEKSKDGTNNGLRVEHKFDGTGGRLCTIREDKGVMSSITFQEERTSRGLKVLTYVPVKATSCDVITRSILNGRTTTRNHAVQQFDALGRSVKTTHQPSGAYRSASFDVLSSTEVDEEGRATTRRTDGLGRLIEVVEHLDMDDDGTTEDYSMLYAYEPRGHLVEVTNQLNGTNDVIFTADFDGRGRQSSSVDAARGEETITYDGLNRTLRTTDARGHTIDYTYDAAGRTRTIVATGSAPVGQTTTYHYDAHPAGSTALCHTTGRLARVEDGSGETVFCYDQRGQPVQHSTVIDEYDPTRVLVTKRSYDVAGRLEQLEYPDGMTLEYGYDRAGRPLSLVATSSGASYELVSSSAYTAAGHLRRLTHGNGAKTKMQFDDRLRKDGVTVEIDGVSTLDLSLALDGVGNVLSVTDTLGDRSATYGYDARYRLTSATGDFADGETLTFAYDANGNLLSRESTDATSPLNVASLIYADLADSEPLHALLGEDGNGDGIADVLFEYDLSGNLTEDDQYGMSFDPFGKLRSVEDSSGTLLMRHTYDFQRRRVATEVPAGSDVFYLRPANAEIRDVAGAEVHRRHIEFAGATIGVIDGAFEAGTEADHIFLFASDHLGTPLLVMDVNSPASVIEEHAVFPFGAENQHPTNGLSLSPDDSTSKLSKRFQGREIDVEFGEFYNFGARMFRSDFARFMSADSIVPDPGSSESWNRYAFVRNNPLRFVDPTGHEDDEPTEPVDIGTRGGIQQQDANGFASITVNGIGPAIKTKGGLTSGEFEPSFYPAPGQKITTDEISLSFGKLSLGISRSRGAFANGPMFKCSTGEGCVRGPISLGIVTADDYEATVGPKLRLRIGPAQAQIGVSKKFFNAPNGDGLRDLFDFSGIEVPKLDRAFGRGVEGGNFFRDSPQWQTPSPQPQNFDELMGEIREMRRNFERWSSGSQY